MSCQNSYQCSSYFKWDQYSPIAQKAVMLTITGVALAGISLVTVGLLSYFNIASGINAMTQWSFIGVGSFSTVCAGLLSLVFAQSRGSSPSVSKPREELKARILQFCEQLEQNADPLEAIHQFAQQISLEELKAVIQIDFPEFSNVWEEALNLLNDAQFYQNATQPHLPSFGAKLVDFKDTVITVIDSTLAAFGVADFFKQAESDLHADFKFQKIMMLISLFTLLTSTLLPLFGVTTGASIVGGILLGLALLSVIWPKIRPMTSRLPEAENLSKQVAMGRLRPKTWRQDDVNKIKSAFEQGKHPILLGATGVGKTQTVYAFVQALERGDFPELAGKKVFYFNTAALVKSFDLFGKNNSILRRIYESMGRHRDQFILIFDEIHEAFQDDKSLFGGKLKTFLEDKPENNFPYVIGITTDEEYYTKIFGKHPSINRRLETIPIESTDELDSLDALHHYVLDLAPQAIVEHGTLQIILDATKTAPQPLAAKKILTSCIEKAIRYENLESAKQVAQLRSRLKVIYGEGAIYGSALLRDEAQRAKEIASIKLELRRLEAEVQEAQKKMEQSRTMQQRFQKIRQAKFQKICEMDQVERSSATEKEKTQLKEVLLIKYFVENSFEKILRVNHGMVINKRLVRSVIEEARANEEKKKEMLVQSQIKFAERQKLGQNQQ